MTSTVLKALVLMACLASATPAAAEWRRSHDITLNTAYTLEQGAVEIGILTPLSVGVTDEVQVAIHPILLLLGEPYVALRWQMTRVGAVTVATNLGASWSFIRRENEDGVPASGAGTGFPGVVQATATVTFKLGDSWLLSAGAGPAIDFLGADPVRGLAEVHLSAHWLLDESQLLMAQLQGYVRLTDRSELVRPLGELLYAVALSQGVSLAAGAGVGEFVFEESSSERRTLNLFPIIDLWFRF
ncbi:MAG: hypothetical protein H6745_17665 [Deltaproteobacteria bacterium]|nr:hypothetical protein [Deltaproteobacteria bacterium]